jgi:hypothetical protein
MKPAIYNLEYIRDTEFDNWIDFYESIQESGDEKATAAISYTSKNGEKKQIELPMNKSDIEHLAYYEALDEIRSMGLSNFYELKALIGKKGDGSQKDFHHYYITRGSDNLVEMHSVKYPVERALKFARIESEQLMKFVEPPSQGTKSLK